MDRITRLCGLAQMGATHRDWYRHANDDINRWAIHQGWSESEKQDFICLLALFSPRVVVYRSIKLALFYHQTGQYHPTVMKGVRAAVDWWRTTGQIRGPKTSAFSLALAGDTQAIVLDVWMARALKVSHRVLSTKSGYLRNAEAIRKVAQRLGWTPVEAQAAIWAAIYRQYRGKWPGMMPFDRVEQESTTLFSPQTT